MGKPIGDWLRSQGIELKTAQRKSRNKAKRNRAAATSCSGLGQAGLANGTNREAGQEEDEGRARMEMDAHLRSCHLGYRYLSRTLPVSNQIANTPSALVHPQQVLKNEQDILCSSPLNACHICHRPSDPDCAELPDKLKPFDSKPGTREINLGMLSYEQLLILSRANSCPGGSPASTLLANPPGILVSIDMLQYCILTYPQARYKQTEFEPCIFVCICFLILKISCRLNM